MKKAKVKELIEIYKFVCFHDVKFTELLFTNKRGFINEQFLEQLQRISDEVITLYGNEGNNLTKIKKQRKS